MFGAHILIVPHKIWQLDKGYETDLVEKRGSRGCGTMTPNITSSRNGHPYPNPFTITPFAAQAVPVIIGTRNRRLLQRAARPCFRQIALFSARRCERGPQTEERRPARTPRKSRCSWRDRIRARPLPPPAPCRSCPLPRNLSPPLVSRAPPQ